MLHWFMVSTFASILLYAATIIAGMIWHARKAAMPDDIVVHSTSRLCPSCGNRYHVTHGLRCPACGGSKL